MGFLNVDISDNILALIILCVGSIIAAIVRKVMTTLIARRHSPIPNVKVINCQVRGDKIKPKSENTIWKSGLRRSGWFGSSQWGATNGKYIYHYTCRDGVEACDMKVRINRG